MSLNIIWEKLNSSELASGLCLFQYVTFGAALAELQAFLCALLLVLRCILALLADGSGSIFCLLANHSVPAYWFPKHFTQVGILLDKYLR